MELVILFLLRLKSKYINKICKNHVNISGTTSTPLYGMINENTKNKEAVNAISFEYSEKNL